MARGLLLAGVNTHGNEDVSLRRRDSVRAFADGLECSMQPDWMSLACLPTGQREAGFISSAR